MAPRVEHELHRRRSGRNLGLLAVLLGFVALVFALSVAKIQQGDLMQAFDHQPRVSALPVDPAAPAPTQGTVTARGVPGAATPPAQPPVPQQ